MIGKKYLKTYWEVFDDLRIINWEDLYKERLLMTDISIVILHYNELDLTQKYIKNIIDLNWKEIIFHIIVVDNASPDGSGKELYRIYDASSVVDVILNVENLGYAKGNNVGIQYAKRTFNSDLYIVSNNDIVINDKEFPSKLYDVYKSSSVAVIGPDIFSLTKNIHQSPIRQTVLSVGDLLRLQRHLELKLRLLKLIQITRSYNLISKIKRVMGMKSGQEGFEYQKAQKNVVLHGAFFVLTKQYLDKFSDGLYDKTFLYLEEDILAYRCDINNLDTIYEPKLKVLHYDGYSTHKLKKNRCKKYMFELEETRKSCGIMLELIKASK